MHGFLPCSLAVLLAGGWCAITAAAGPLDAGDAQCPCADVAALGQAVAGLPKGFGLGCAPHYMNPNASQIGAGAQCQGVRAPLPRWCNNSWCFVDPQNCWLPTAFLGEPALYYSYQTCGYLDSETPEAVSTQLQGQTFRVVYLNNTAGYSGSYNFGGWQGPTFKYWMAVLANAQVVPAVALELRTSPYPNLSLPYPGAVMRQFRADYPTSRSIFDSCVYAAGMGFVDLCIGAFTVNEARVRISQMVEHFQVDIKLVVKQYLADETITDQLAAAWAPFSTELWFLIFGVVVAASLLIVLHERIASPEPIKLRTLADWHRLGGGIAFAFYDGWLAFWGGGRGPADPNALAGRLTSMGLVMFVLMSVSAYTANMATFLVKTPSATSDITNVQDIIDNPNFKICCEAQIVDAMVSKLGIPKAQIVGLGSRATILSTLDAGDQCQAAAVYAEDVIQAHSKLPGGTFCQYQDIGFLMTIGQGVPVSDKVARVMQWGHKLQEKAGTWDGLLKTTKDSFKNLCDPIVPKVSDATPLDAGAMLGSLVVGSAFFAAAVMVSFVNCLRRCRSRNDTLKEKVEYIEKAGPPTSHSHADDLEDIRARLDAMVSEH